MILSEHTYRHRYCVFFNNRHLFTLLATELHGFFQCFRLYLRQSIFTLKQRSAFLEDNIIAVNLKNFA